MISNHILSMWEFTRNTFTEKISKLDDKDFLISDGKVTIGQIVYHTSQAEYIFLEWFFNSQLKQDMPKDIHENKEALMIFLHDSNKAVLKAIKQLPEDKWSISIDSKMGKSTPAEAIARLIYHAGIHSGQITSMLRNQNSK